MGINVTGFKLPIRLSEYVKQASALFTFLSIGKLLLAGNENKLISCVQNEGKLSNVRLVE